MKKILSLVLAVLMLASLAVSTSAVNILSSDHSHFIKKSNDKATFGDMLEIYEMLGLDVPFGGAVNYKGNIYYTWWYEDCPKCDGWAFFYVDDGDIMWKCLESKCGESGIYKESGNKKDDDDFVGDDAMFVGPHCPSCDSDNTQFIKVVETVYGQLRNRYYCFKCQEYFTTKLTDIDYDSDYVYNDIKCPDCSKTAEFDYFFTLNGKLYARYVCGNGHKTDRRVYSNLVYDKDEYNVRVICSRGGDYDITGSSKATYNEKKTIEFYPSQGYVLTDVLVNGKSVDVSKDNTITITVTGNTVVRAYFEKASKLQSYTITANASGNGRITAKKNGESVNSAKVSAKYVDSVTYKFIPASGNYYVSDVKVDGKSVGKVNSYTLSKLDGNHTIDVKFAWNNPFADVKDKYLNAVEYVTESGIMSAAAKSNNKTYFSGNVKVSVQTFAAALAEMADTADKLDTTDERILWAIKYDLIDKKDDLTATCDVQTACAMVRAFMEALEDINDISFVDLKVKDTVKETAIAIDMVSASTYDNNRKLNRYDLASVCYLVAGLEYID